MTAGIVQPVQRFTPQVQATSDASGNVTFDFGYVPRSLVWTGAVSVAPATSSALWTIQVAGTTVGQFLGQGVQPVQVWDGERLQLVGTGCAPSTLMTASFVGFSQGQSLATPYVPPPVPLSLQTTVVTQGPGSGGLALNGQFQIQNVTVAAGGFPSHLLTQGAIFLALSTNSASVYVGANHTGGTTTANGFELVKSAAVWLPIQNTNMIAAAGANTDVICVLAL